MSSSAANKEEIAASENEDDGTKSHQEEDAVVVAVVSKKKRWKQLELGKGAFIKPPPPPKDLNNYLPSIPNDVLTAAIFSFLSVVDLSELGVTCKEMAQHVSRSRPTNRPACVLWEERRHVMIDYLGQDRDLCTVSQVIPFYFLLRAPNDGQRIRVEFLLFNEMWEEDANMRDGHRCSRFQGYAGPTKYRVNITRQQQDGTWTAEFHCCSVCPGGGCFHGGLSNNRLRKNCKLIALCAKRIAAFPDQFTDYPSAEYLMQVLPEGLRKFIPKSFDLKQSHSDREIDMEFTYRPARTLREWRAFAAVYPGELCRYTLYEVPWYSFYYEWDLSDDEDDWSEDEDEDESSDEDDGDNAPGGVSFVIHVGL